MKMSSSLFGGGGGSLSSAIFGGEATTTTTSKNRKRNPTSGGLFDKTPPTSHSAASKEIKAANKKAKTNSSLLPNTKTEDKKSKKEPKVSAKLILQKRKTHANLDFIQRHIVLSQPQDENGEEEALPREVQIQEMADAFLEHGVSVLPKVVSAKVTDEMSQAADTILKEIQEKLPTIGTTIERYQEVATRCPGRMDTRYKTNQGPFSESSVVENDTIWPLVQQLLGPTATLVYSGLIYSFPGSEDQPWHQDGEPLFPELLDDNHAAELMASMPPYALNVFIPLSDEDGALEAGPTEFVPGSHILPVHDVMERVVEYQIMGHTEEDEKGDDEGEKDNNSRGSVSSETSNDDAIPPVIISPILKQGDALLYDYRICHRGTTNLTHQLAAKEGGGRVRRILYLMYARPWFKEHLNFGETPLFNTATTNDNKDNTTTTTIHPSSNRKSLATEKDDEPLSNGGKNKKRRVRKIKSSKKLSMTTTATMMMQCVFLCALWMLILAPAAAVRATAAKLEQKQDPTMTTIKAITPAAAAALSHYNHKNKTSNATACAKFKDLPEECHCKEPGHHQVKIDCLKPFDSIFFNDTIGLLINFDPCNAEGSKMDVEIIEVNHNIEYTIAGIDVGEEQIFPIPGMSIVVPTLGHVGLDLVVLMEGNPDMLKVKLGLDACAVVHDRQVCASSIPGLNLILPWYVLQGNYTFGDYCETWLTSGTPAAKATTSSEQQQTE